MADVDKDDVTGFVGIWKIGLGDAVAKCDGCCVVDETKDVETCDGCSVEDGATLDIWIPAWNGYNDVCDAHFEFVGSDVTQFSEIHGYELGGCEDMSLAEIVDLMRTIVRFFTTME